MKQAWKQRPFECKIKTNGHEGAQTIHIAYSSTTIFNVILNV